MSAKVSRVWLEVSTLNVHSVYDELLIHPHYMDQCREMFGLVFSINQLLGTIPQLNQVCQVGLQLLKKEIEFCEKYGSTNACYDLFHPASLSFTLCPTQRIPTKRFLAPTPAYPLDFQIRFPPSPYKCSFLYASNSTAQITFRRHQPSASTLYQS